MPPPTPQMMTPASIRPIGPTAVEDLERRVTALDGLVVSLCAIIAARYPGVTATSIERRIHQYAHEASDWEPPREHGDLCNIHREGGECDCEEVSASQ